MNTSGFYALKRTIKEWGWYHDPKMFSLFMHLLIDANYEDGEWEGHMVKRGQLVTSIQLLSVDTGLSKQEVRTCMKKLGGAGEVLSRSIGKRSILTICNYDKYEERQHDSNTDATQMQHDTNTDATQEQHAIIKQYNKGTKEQDKKEKVILTKEKSIEDREYAFKEQVYAFSSEWQRQMLDDFILYWSERDLRGKMRFEKEKTWDLPKRLQRWDRNNVERGRASMRVTASAPPKTRVRLSPEEIALDAKRNHEPLAFNVRQAIDIIWEGTIPKERVDAALSAAGYEI